LMFKLRSGAVVDMLRQEVGAKMEARDWDRDGPGRGVALLKDWKPREKGENRNISQEVYIKTKSPC
jgi:hypothetical protein